MSLLMDALKKAELAKRQSGKDKTAASTPPPSLELTPLESGQAAVPFAEEQPVEPAPGERAPAGSESLPTLPQSLELLDQEFMDEAAAFSRRKPETPPETVPPEPEPAPPLAGTPHRTETVPAPGPIEPPPALSRGSRAQLSSETQAERDAAQNLFEAKKPEAKNRTLLIALGLFGLMAGLAIGIYFWIQLQPKSSLAGRGLAASPATNLQRPTASTPVSGTVQSPPPPQPAAAPEPEAAPAEVAAKTETPKTSAAPAPRTETQPRNLIRVTKESAILDPSVERGFQALQRGDLGVAQSAYEQALKEDPRNADALHGLASIRMRQGRIDQAEELYLRAIESDPQDALAQANLISLNSRIDPIQSESRLKLLLSTQPESPFLHFYLGNLYARQNRWAEAQQAYFKAMAGDPANPDYLFNLAVSLDQLHQAKPAAQYYGRALQAAANRPAGFDKQQVTERLSQLQRQEP